MRAPSSAVRKTVSKAALPLGILLSALLVYQSSYAAFTATTTNPGNSWNTGSVVLTDDHNGHTVSPTVMFTVSGLKPGDAGVRCIRVAYEGSLAAQVRVHGTVTAETKSLAGELDLTITEGSGTVADCSDFVLLATPSTAYTGTLTAFVTAHPTSGTGYGTFDPDGSATAYRTYRIGYELPSTAPDSVQDSSATATFAWQATNT